MIRCIAIGNNISDINLLEEHIINTPFLKLLKTFINPFDAIEFLGNEQVDLLFTEMEIPKLNGMQLIACLTKCPMVIMVSASDKYAIDGFNMGAIDYLLKPFTFERFLRAANKAREYYNVKIAPLQAAAPIEDSSDDMIKDYIFVRSDYKTIRIDLNEILLIEGLKDYVKIHTPEKSVLSLLSLKNIETRLSANQFIRVHRSYIVALNKIDSIEKSRIKIGKYHIPVSDLYKEAFFKRIQALNI